MRADQVQSRVGSERILGVEGEEALQREDALLRQVEAIALLPLQALVEVGVRRLGQELVRQGQVGRQHHRRIGILQPQPLQRVDATGELLLLVESTSDLEVLAESLVDRRLEDQQRPLELAQLAVGATDRQHLVERYVEVGVLLLEHLEEAHDRGRIPLLDAHEEHHLCGFPERILVQLITPRVVQLAETPTRLHVVAIVVLCATQVEELIGGRAIAVGTGPVAVEHGQRHGGRDGEAARLVRAAQDRREALVFADLRSDQRVGDRSAAAQLTDLDQQATGMHLIRTMVSRHAALEQLRPRGQRNVEHEVVTGIFLGWQLGVVGELHVALEQTPATDVLDVVLPAIAIGDPPRHAEPGGNRLAAVHGSGGQELRLAHVEFPLLARLDLAREAPQYRRPVRLPLPLEGQGERDRPVGTVRQREAQRAPAIGSGEVEGAGVAPVEGNRDLHLLAGRFPLPARARQRGDHHTSRSAREPRSAGEERLHRGSDPRRLRLAIDQRQERQRGHAELRAVPVRVLLHRPRATLLRAVFGHPFLEHLGDFQRHRRPPHPRQGAREVSEGGGGEVLAQAVEPVGGAEVIRAGTSQRVDDHRLELVLRPGDLTEHPGEVLARALGGRGRHDQSQLTRSLQGDQTPAAGLGVRLTRASSPRPAAVTGLGGDQSRNEPRRAAPDIGSLGALFTPGRGEQLEHGAGAEQVAGHVGVELGASALPGPRHRSQHRVDQHAIDAGPHVNLEAAIGVFAAHRKLELGLDLGRQHPAGGVGVLDPPGADRELFGGLGAVAVATEITGGGDLDLQRTRGADRRGELEGVLHHAFAADLDADHLVAVDSTAAERGAQLDLAALAGEVVDPRRHRQSIAFGQELRHVQLDEKLRAGDELSLPFADRGLAVDAAAREPPARAALGNGEADPRPTIDVGDHRGSPEGGVGVDRGDIFSAPAVG